MSHEKISGSPHNPERPYFNCLDFPNGCDLFIWGDEKENYVDPTSLNGLYVQFQKQGQLIMENNTESRELKSKQLFKKAFTTGFITATTVCVMLIVLFARVFGS